nr:DNA-directed DNA polymerase [Tanacetum cinerariifolium]
MPRECLKIIESKSKVRQSRAKVVVAKVNTSSSTPAVSTEVAELKDMVRAFLLDKKNQSSAPASSSTPAPVKAVEPNCVTCGSGTPPSNTITNPKEDLKGITTRSGVAYQGPPIPTQSKVVKQGTKIKNLPIVSLTKNGSPRYSSTNYKVSLRRVVPRNYSPKGAKFLIASRFPIPPLACEFFNPGATVKVPMADNRTMAKLLQAPTKGYEDAIVIPEITANNFELKHGLINLVQNKQFFRHDKEDAHAHIRYFNMFTSTMRVPNVPSSSIKLMLFPFSLEGAARIWLEKEPPRSILTWDDLVSKFINQFFPPSKTTNLRHVHIMDFPSCINSTHSINTLNVNDQDSLNSSAGGNFLDKMPRECLKIIESKSKVRQSRAKAVIAKVSTSSSTPAISSDVAELKDMVRALLLDKKNQSSALAQSSTPAPVKEIEPNCVTCGGTHSYQNCPATSGNAYRDNIQENRGDQGPSANSNSQSTSHVQPPVVQPETQTLIFEPVVPPVSASMPNVKSSIPYPLRHDNERHRDQANEQIEKSYEIFKDMSFEISFTDALILMPKFAFTLKALIGNKEKLSEMARTPMNKHCSATGRALIDVHKGELTLRIGNEAITYNLDQTVRYSSNYIQITTNKIDVICEEYSQEVLGFFDVTGSGNPTPHDDLIVSTTGGHSLLEAILNSEPLPPLDNHEQYLPSFKKELKVCEAKTVKTSIDEPHEVELKDLPPYLKYAFLESDNKLPVIIAKELGDEEKSALIKVLKSHKRAIAWKLSNIQGINPEFYTHKILMEEDYKPAVQHQRRVNPKIHDVIKKENEENELIPTRLVTRWWMLERLSGNEFYGFLDGFSGYFQIPINPRDQEKTTFTCPYGTFAYRRMPFGLCNAPGTFQRCMLAIFHNMVEKTMEVFMDDFSSHFMVKEGIVLGYKISKNGIEVDRAKVVVIAKLPHLTTVKGTFQRCMLSILHDMVEKTMEVFMDDFSVFKSSFENCLSRLDKMLQRCEDTNLSLNWEKSHFMVKKGIVLSHKISKIRIEVDRAKVNVIAKLPHPTTIKGV